jgi:drug/metabolite transporter (DMT)-like permease
MTLMSLLFAIGAGALVSLLPLLSWWQGEGLARQMWLILYGHLLSLPVLSVLLAALGHEPVGVPFLLAGAAAGACSGFNGALYYAAVMNRGPMAISWAIIWLSAVVVAVAGWVVFGEPVYAAQPVALLAFVACLIVMARASHLSSRQVGQTHPVRPGYWLYLIVAMLFGVAGSLLIKWQVGQGNKLTFVFALVCGLTVALLATVAAKRVRPVLDGRTLLAAVGWGAVVTPLYLCLVWGLYLADASVYQPTQSGAALVLGVGWAWVRGERPGRLALLGAALALLSVVLINVKV